MKRVQITEQRVLGTALDRLTGANNEAPAPEKEVTGQSRPPMIKLSVFLNRDEDTYLESLGSAAKFSGGKKISKTKLIEGMVRAFRHSKLDVSGVSSDEELLNRIIAQLR
jgi:hypothetical protein